MPGPVLVDMPVHAVVWSSKTCMRYMPTLRTPVWGSTVFTIGKGYETPAVGRPALRDRKRRERRLSTRLHDLLAFAPPRHRTREPAGHPGQQRQRPQLVRERRARRQGLPQQSVDPFRGSSPSDPTPAPAPCGVRNRTCWSARETPCRYLLGTATPCRRRAFSKPGRLSRRSPPPATPEPLCWTSSPLALQRGDILTQASVHAPTPFSPTRIAAATPVPAPRKPRSLGHHARAAPPRVCRSSTAC